MQIKVKYDDKRTWLENVPHLYWGGYDTYTDDFMFPSALRVCLDYIGQKHTKYFLAGVSGAAFDIGWCRETLNAGAGGAIFAHPNHFEAGVKNLFAAIGRTFEIVYRSDPTMWEKIVQSINAGKPVVTSEWEIDHFAVIAGHEADGKTLLVQRYCHRTESPQEYVPIALDSLAFVVIIGNKIRAISPHEAAIRAIEFAVTSAGTGIDTRAKGQGGTKFEMIYGPEAYAKHAGLILEGLDPSLEIYGWRQHVFFWRLDVLQLARSYAIEYLCEIREYMSTSEQQHIDVAMQYYNNFLRLIASENAPMENMDYSPNLFRDPHLAILFSRHQEIESEPLFWVEDGLTIHIRKKLESQDGRRDLADLLLKMKGLEEKSIAELQLILGR